VLLSVFVLLTMCLQQKALTVLTIVKQKSDEAEERDEENANKYWLQINFSRHFRHDD